MRHRYLHVRHHHFSRTTAVVVIDPRWRSHVLVDEMRHRNLRRTTAVAAMDPRGRRHALVEETYE